MFLRSTDPPAKDLLRPPVMLGSFFLLGFSPVLRGTAGTLGALLISLPMLALDDTARAWAFVASFAFFSVLSLLVGRAVLRRFPALLDPGWFVLDEVAGYFAVLVIMGAKGPLDICFAFLTFRVYDICKPWPVRAFERLPGSVGILADDLAAAVLAGFVCLALGALAPLS
jgi:phosphatidylglycerophosphatase A